MKEPLRASRLAVLIPTLNEESTLGATLDALLAQSDEIGRILVADGGSTDRTRALAEERGVGVIVVPKAGRGGQSARAVRELDEEIVIIVHADMLLNLGVIGDLRRWLDSHPGCPGGCLGHRFDSDRWIYRVFEWCDRVRARRGTSYGDQAQFFRRELLESQGGMPDLPIMEDLELCRRLRRLGQPAYLDRPVVVSPRRIERLGWPRAIIRNFWFRIVYRIGGRSACRWLYRRYYPDNS